MSVTNWGIDDYPRHRWNFQFESQGLLYIEQSAVIVIGSLQSSCNPIMLTPIEFRVTFILNRFGDVHVSSCDDFSLSGLQTTFRSQNGHSIIEFVDVFQRITVIFLLYTGTGI